MRAIFYIGIFLLTIVGCKAKKEVTKSEITTSDGETIGKYFSQSEEVKNKETLEANKGKNAIVYGTIIREEFINKGGHATGNFETLIKLEDGETVHLRNKGENKYDYKKLEGKKVKMEAVIFYGNIDSDNPEHQSRVGYRIDYITITALD
jgi:hypothetical protein